MQRLMQRLLLALCLLVVAPRTAFATWSVIAIDTKTGQVIIASATCVRQSAFPLRTPVAAPVSSGSRLFPAIGSIGWSR